MPPYSETGRSWQAVFRSFHQAGVASANRSQIRAVPLLLLYGGSWRAPTIWRIVESPHMFTWNGITMRRSSGWNRWRSPMRDPSERGNSDGSSGQWKSTDSLSWRSGMSTRIVVPHRE